ncbi:MAG: hypothetical protein JWP44_733 [Mucilaginibacter sp.]|nr:hypothetical protein [Mucilaginibacter sp.]
MYYYKNNTTIIISFQFANKDKPVQELIMNELDL